MRNLRGIAGGIVMAVALVTGWTLLEGLRAGCATRDCLVPLSDQVSIAFSMSLGCAMILTACGVPVWLTLKRFGWSNIYSTAFLGFLLPLAFWTPLGLSPRSSLADVAISGVPYAACGLLSALACWAAGGSAPRNVR